MTPTTTTTTDQATDLGAAVIRAASILAAVILAAVIGAASMVSAALVIAPTQAPTTTAPTSAPTPTTTAPTAAQRPTPTAQRPTTTAPTSAPMVCDDLGAAVCGRLSVVLAPDGRAIVSDDRGTVADGVVATYHTTTGETGSAPSVVEYLSLCPALTVADGRGFPGVSVVGVAVGAVSPGHVIEYHTAAAVIGADTTTQARCVIAVVAVDLY